MFVFMWPLLSCKRRGRAHVLHGHTRTQTCTHIHALLQGACRLRPWPCVEASQKREEWSGSELGSYRRQARMWTLVGTLSALPGYRCVCWCMHECLCVCDICAKVRAHVGFFCVCVRVLCVCVCMQAWCFVFKQVDKSAGSCLCELSYRNGQRYLHTRMFYCACVTAACSACCSLATGFEDGQHHLPILATCSLGRFTRFGVCVGL